MKYPKLPTGPTPVGAAKVRGLQARGGAFQRSRPTVDTEAKRSGQFSKATTENIQYLSVGMLHLEKPKRVGGRRYIMPFMPTMGNPLPINMGRGKYAGWVVGQPEPAPVVKTYTYMVGGEPVEFTQTEQLKTVHVVEGSFWRRGNISMATAEMAIRFDHGYDTLLPNIPSLTLTAPAPSHDDARQLMSVMLIDNGRRDEADKPLFDVMLAGIWSNYAPDPIVLDVATFTNTDAEFHDIVKLASGKTTTLALVSELFFQWDDDGPAMGPALWALSFPGHDTRSPTAANLAPWLFEDRWLPSKSGELWMPGDGALYNARLGFTMGTLKLLAMPGGFFLAFYRLFCDDAKWHNRIARIGTTGGISVNVLSDTVEDGGLADFVQDAIHIGQGVIVTKVVRGFDGTGFHTELRKSSNFGTSWTTLPLMGFELPSPHNQYFGNLTLHRAKTSDKDAVLLMPAWSSAKGAYYVYESTDEGVTWERKGRIYKPPTFHRVDSMVVGDGGGNFEDLTPGPDPLRAIDLAWPDRYDKD